MGQRWEMLPTPAMEATGAQGLESRRLAERSLGSLGKLNTLALDVWAAWREEAALPPSGAPGLPPGSSPAFWHLPPAEAQLPEDRLPPDAL